jgi:hypothetical protein
VCKYWCQLTAYLTEKQENPELTDDDFEILFDYEASKDDGRAVTANIVDTSKDPNFIESGDTKRISGESSVLSLSQSDAPGSNSPAPRGMKRAGICTPIMIVYFSSM